VSVELAIATKGLTKRFGEQFAVDSVDLRVPRGSVFGFLGPNGSGKTTTIRMLLGLANSTAGETTLLGYQIPNQLSHALPRVGALVEGPAFYPYMSGRNNLIRLDAADRFADVKTRKHRVSAALERVGLTNAANKKVHAYSLGMKQRLGIANALLKPRDLLILDEPTNGLDPQGTREVRNLIRNLAEDGITIFVSSHLLSEIEQLCTDVAVMSAGKIVAQGNLEELRNSEPAHLLLRAEPVSAATAVLGNFGLSDITDLNSGLLRINAPEGISVPEINRELVANGVSVYEIRLERQSLEERFVALTGEGFDVLQ
jgi:ABC-2 type transport system ATP-binding protein